MDIQAVALKTCTACQAGLPATTEYFHLHRPSSRSSLGDGLKPACKRCQCEKAKKAYRSLDPEKKAAYIKNTYKWAKDNRELVSRAKSRWLSRNVERRKASRARHYQRKREEPGFRLVMNVARGVSAVLAGDKQGRHWEYLVGYTADELKSHLESRFIPGMTWENYGKWHVDHIRPISSFVITSAECDAFRECWALKNLQPLWAIDNLRKFSKWTS